MEHRRDVGPAVRGAKAEFLHGGEGVRADVAMREDHTLRGTGRAARVVQVGGFVGRGERWGERARVAGGDRIRDRDAAAAQMLAEFGRAGCVRIVVQQQERLTVRKDVLLLAGGEARVQRDQDRAGGGGREVGEVVVDVVVHQAADAIAALHSAFAKGRRELGRELSGFGIRVHAGPLAKGLVVRVVGGGGGEEVPDVHSRCVAAEPTSVAGLGCARRCA
jgi:hypothetical protein